MHDIFMLFRSVVPESQRAYIHWRFIYSDWFAESALHEAYALWVAPKVGADWSSGTRKRRAYQLEGRAVFDPA